MQEVQRLLIVDLGKFLIQILQLALFFHLILCNLLKSRLVS